MDNNKSNNKAAAPVFRPVGELTIYTAADSKARLLEALADCVDIEVDISQVSAMDTAGLQVLVLARMEALRRSVPFRLTGRSAAVLEVVELCNLAELFNEPPGVPYEQLSLRHAS